MIFYTNYFTKKYKDPIQTLINQLENEITYEVKKDDEEKVKLILELERIKYVKNKDLFKKK